MKVLVRGTPVVVADSVGQPALRGAKMIVASKGSVKCNGKGRCAGPWCSGQAVFLTTPESNKEDKEMGWRGGTTKVCLTHVKDEEGNLIVPPPAMRVAQEALERQQSPRPDLSGDGVVSWEELAKAASDRDLTTLVMLARRLKRENESLRTKVIEAQGKLIEHLSAR